MAQRPRTRIVAVAGLLFAAAAIAFAAPGYVLPSVGFFALMLAAWFGVVRRSARRG
jgi:arginine:agmatine antiporter